MVIYYLVVVNIFSDIIINPRATAMRMQKIDIKLLVHMQKGSAYASHPGIDSTAAMLIAGTSVNLLAKPYGEALFKTSLSWPSLDNGLFDPNLICECVPNVIEGGCEPLDIAVEMLGGQLEFCLQNAFKCVLGGDKRIKYTHSTAIRMPLDLIFYVGTGRDAMTGRELRAWQPDLFRYLINRLYSVYVNGNTVITNDEILFEVRK